MVQQTGLTKLASASALIVNHSKFRPSRILSWYVFLVEILSCKVSFSLVLYIVFSEPGFFY